MSQVFEPSKHDIQIGIGILKQVIQNRGHNLDIIREALSNSCAEEVQASYVKINVQWDGTYGWSMVFEDDGIGMDYSGAREGPKMGRMDKFLNLAYSGVAGLKSDEFSYKGIGSKLMYLCRKLEIETKTAKGESHRAIVDEPYAKITKKEPELPVPYVYKDVPLPFEHGTIIRVWGYDNGASYPEYQEYNQLEEYLYFRTIVGCTQPERAKRLPKIIVSTPTAPNRELVPGYKWIRKEGSHVEGQKIGVVPPTTITKSEDKGKKVTVTLKGGYALKTSEFGMAAFGMRVGLKYAWKGIPYFDLDFNRFKGDLELYYKFCNFVVECDDVDVDMARNAISPDPVRYWLFEDALRQAFRSIRDTEDYKEWVKFRRDLKKRDLGTSLNSRKEALLRSEQKWVYVDGELIHKVPENEEDTHALLWKLEGMKVLPFHYFRTLEHTAQEGIDIIAEYQETEYSEKKMFQSVEIEHILENYLQHDHVPEQTSVIIAWDSRKLDDLKKTELPSKFVWNLEGSNLTVYLIKRFPRIELKTK